ncbi:class A beta-lactamase [Blastomonas sp.]|jgi:beta-lactamase class A|uniref:class A beta-lactamase n=1 Tax=Blastomonas TaxID=150203 RepID=UPI00258DA14E|nr:class A beta-lactamase [Blastomonas sp.]
MIGRALILGTAALLSGCATTAPEPTTDPAIARELAAIEARSGGRLGVALVGPDGHELAGHRADERFAMCSTFKLPLAVMVLENAHKGRLSMADPLPVTDSDMVVYSPYVEAQRAKTPPEAVTVEGAASAAVSLSDNTAANLLLDRLGGPQSFTAWLRGKRDSVTRLDRREPELNENALGDPRDTTTPAAMAETTRSLVVGNAIPVGQQRLLYRWMENTSTGLKRIRGGLPQGWSAGDKTGSCGNAFNDVAVFTAETGMRYTLAVYLDRPAVKGDAASAIIADATRAVLPALR